MKAVVLLSGGLDSTTTLAVAVNMGYDVFTLSFDYGQRHSKELAAVKEIISYYKVKSKFLTIPLNEIGGSALTDNMDVPLNRNINDEIPITYVPARNTILLSFALAYAETIKSNDIFIGANAIDFSGYPDCRPEYFEAFEKMCNLATKSGVEGNSIKIHTPLLGLTKAEIIKLGERLKVPYNLTWSCYKGEEKACGECDSCLLRLKGFMEADSEDSIAYQKFPGFYKEYLNHKN